MISEVNSVQNFTANFKKTNSFFGELKTTDKGNKYYASRLNEKMLPVAGALFSGALFGKHLFTPALNDVKQFNFSAMKGCKDVFKGMGKVGALIGATFMTALFTYTGIQAGRAAGKGLDDYTNELKAKNADKLADYNSK